MALGDGSFRSRAASLLRPSATSKGQSLAQGTPSNTHAEVPLNEKASEREGQNGLEKSQTLSSSGKTYQSSDNNAVIHDREAQRIVRTIPAWVHTLDEDDESLVAAARSLLDAPANVRIAQHNSTTETSQKRRSDPSRGRLYDHDREWTPPLPKESVTQSGSRWRTFVNASAYPATSAEGGKIVTQDWLLENGADYSRPWLAGATDGDPEKNLAVLYRFKARRRAWYIRAQRTVLRNSMVPLIIRMNVWFFSAVALGLASSIHHMAGNSSTGGQTPSTNMAIIVDAVALVYLVYITYDEYSGKPLGLRPAIAKMRLIFLDLFFIVFDSANLSLAFAAAGPQNCKNGSCGREKALASVLLFALIAWLLTFSISVMRLVERVTGR